MTALQEMAVVKLLEYLNDGYLWIVDIDLEKFFDFVPQDKLMSLVHEIIDDPDTESLIRNFLQARNYGQGNFSHRNSKVSIYLHC